MIRFIEKHGKIILVILIVVVIAVISSVAIAEIQTRNKDRALAELEEFESRIEEEEIALEEFIEEADAIASMSRNAYIRDQLAFLTARAYWENGEYEEAAERYLSLAQKDPLTHLGQISYFNAAIAYEEHGDSARAISILEEALTEYEFIPNPIVPRMLLNLGRLYEIENNSARAVEYYNQLIQNHGGNELINLAYNRLIIIERLAADG